jgi:hypothetical protein
MPLSTLPTISGLTLPAGVQKVKHREVETTYVTKKEKVTVLEDTEEQYADPPLVEAAKVTATDVVTASGLIRSDTVLAVTDPSETEGWICESYQEVREAGKYATWDANYSYYPPEGS